MAAENPQDLVEYQSDHDILIDLRRIVVDMRSDFVDAKKEYVTRAEFWPVKALVYGCVALMLSILISALVYLVIHK
jgi:hypothetical protein